MTYLLVFLGGGLGAMCRHGVNLAGTRWLGAFPAATLFINVTGSFVMGLAAGYFAFRSGDLSQHARLFFTTGILGGYTTFSAFSLDAVLLWERGQMVNAAAYVGASVVLALAGLVAGLSIMRALT